MTRIPKPRSLHDYSKPFTHPSNMCGTCAYRVPPTPEDVDMAHAHIMDTGDCEHPCHERVNHICKGSAELDKTLKKPSTHHMEDQEEDQ